MQLLWLTLMISLTDLCEIQKLCREQVKIKEKGMGTDGTVNWEWDDKLSTSRLGILSSNFLMSSHRPSATPIKTIDKAYELQGEMNSMNSGIISFWKQSKTEMKKKLLHVVSLSVNIDLLLTEFSLGLINTSRYLHIQNVASCLLSSLHKAHNLYSWAKREA